MAAPCPRGVLAAEAMQQPCRPLHVNVRVAAARGSDHRNGRGHGGRAASAATTNHRQAQAAAYENIESGDEDEDINEHLGSSGGSMVILSDLHVLSNMFIFLNGIPYFLLCLLDRKNQGKLV